MYNDQWNNPRWVDMLLKSIRQSPIWVEKNYKQLRKSAKKKKKKMIEGTALGSE